MKFKNLLILLLISFNILLTNPVLSQQSPAINFASCSKTASCILDKVKNYKQLYDDCAKAILNCGKICMAGIAIWSLCFSYNCSCKSESLSWSCVDTCRDSSGSDEFVTLLNCLIDPCRTDLPMWIIILIIASTLIVLAAVGFGIYKCCQCRKKKNRYKGNNIDNKPYGHIHHFNKITSK